MWKISLPPLLTAVGILKPQWNKKLATFCGERDTLLSYIPRIWGGFFLLYNSIIYLPWAKKSLSSSGRFFSGKVDVPVGRFPSHLRRLPSPLMKSPEWLMMGARLRMKSSWKLVMFFIWEGEENNDFRWIFRIYSYCYIEYIYICFFCRYISITRLWS